MNSSHFYKKSAFTPLLFGISSILAITQLIFGWYIESLLLSCSAIFYYIIFIFFVRLRKKESLISFSTDCIVINQLSFSWENFQKIEFVTRKNNQEQIETQLHFFFEEQKTTIIPSHYIEQFEKQAFLDELKKYQTAFFQQKEHDKKGYSLTPIEEKLQLNYPSEMKIFLEELQQPSTFSILTQSFQWLDIHQKNHQHIISLSQQLSKITSTIPNQVNSLVIAQGKQDSNAILFISNLNNEMRYGTENKVFYYHFNYPEFYPIQITYNFKELITPLINLNLLDTFQLTDHELPEEQGIIAIEPTQQKSTWDFEYQINKKKLGTEILVHSNFYIQEENTTTFFQYESIFMDSNTEHHAFYEQPAENILAIILQNLSLTNLKFAQQAWIQKEKNIDNWNDCFNSTHFHTVLLNSIQNIKKGEN